MAHCKVYSDILYINYIYSTRGGQNPAVVNDYSWLQSWPGPWTVRCLYPQLTSITAASHGSSLSIPHPLSSPHFCIQIRTPGWWAAHWQRSSARFGGVKYGGVLSPQEMGEPVEWPYSTYHLYCVRGTWSGVHNSPFMPCPVFHYQLLSFLLRCYRKHHLFAEWLLCWFFLQPISWVCVVF